MIDFITANERKRCKQLAKCEDIIDSVRVKLACGRDSSCIAHGMRRLKRYLDKVFPDKKAKARLDALLEERKEMFEALIRINNWCCQDLMENAYVGQESGNYYKTLTGLAAICRPFAELYNSLKEYEGKYEWWLTRETPERKPIQTKTRRDKNG